MALLQQPWTGVEADVPTSSPRAGAQLLAHANRLLASTLDYELTLQRVTRLAVPYLAEWCLTVIVEHGRDTPRVEIAHIDPPAEQELLEAFSGDSQDGDGGSRLAAWEPLTRALRTGCPAFVSGSRVRALGALAGTPGARAIGETRSAFVIPLITDGHPFGALALGSTRHYAHTRFAVAKELAGRGAMALEHARRYRAAQERLMLIAHELKMPVSMIGGYSRVLQRSLLDEDGPDAERLQHGLTRIAESARRMADMVDQLLDASRAAAGVAGCIAA